MLFLGKKWSGLVVLFENWTGKRMQKKMTLCVQNGMG
jgi:hypothetical protein